MSISKVVWSSPEINQNRKIKNAKFLNDSSLKSLKFQVLFFLIILFEIYFSLFKNLFKVEKQSFIIYRLICKTLLTVNLIFLLCYAFQILQAKYILFTVNDNCLKTILKRILLNIVPNLKSYSDKLVQCKLLSFIFSKSVSDEEKERLRQMEERRKILTKSYFPSMLTQYNNYGDQYIAIAAMNRDKANYPAYINNSHSIPSGDYELIKPMQASTPFNNLRVGSITFGGDITPIQSPGFPDIRNSSCSTNIKYQPSTPSPPRVGSRYSPGGVLSNKSQQGVFLEVPLNEVWKRLGIDHRLLNDWAFSLRQWIHGTIIMRVVTEIDSINARFKELGITDVVIGESNVQTLRHLTSQPMNPFPTLGALINFLDCSKDQAYVVNRLKELSQGCSLGKFQWDCGSSSVRHAWKEHLPNDTMLILHVVCTYIEIKYAVHSNLHGVRTFSQQFITDNVLNKDIVDMKDAFLLYQTSVQPPNFKVIFNQSIYEIPPGRNNLFHCLLVFFYKIYNNEGNFKWLNLGRSGMNINFIFDK